MSFVSAFFNKIAGELAASARGRQTRLEHLSARHFLEAAGCGQRHLARASICRAVHGRVHLRMGLGVRLFNERTLCQ